MPVITSDIDPDYNALVEGDSGAGADFPWEHAATDTHVLDHALKPPTHGGGGGGGGGGGSTFPTQAMDAQAGPTFDTNATVNGNYFIPPDSTSAAGQTAILVGVNGVVEEFDRGGTDGNTLTSHAGFKLDDVFSGATGFLGGAFDPHIMYDAASDRFIVVAVDQNATNKTSQLLVAVSNNGSPQGAADFHAVAIDATQAASGSWADFPQVGLDHSGNIYITGNMFTFAGGSYSGTRLWVESETNVSGGVGASAVNVSAVGAGANDFFSAAPTNMGSASGNFLISYNSATNAAGHNVLHVVHVDASGNLGAEQTIDLGGKIDQLTTFAGISVPEPGTSHTLDGDDSRTSLAVLSGNNNLYVAATILPTSGADAGHATAHWFQLGVDSSGHVSLLNQGDVSGNAAFPGSNLRTFYPSLAVSTDANGNDELAISFSTSAPQTGTAYDGFPSAYEETINPATGTSTLGWQLLEGGLANYYRTFGTHDNRWGDYSSISADPLHPGQYWAFNQFAETHGTSLLGENGRWATELGLFS